MASTNAAVLIDTAVSLDWEDVSGANLYHLQVSLYPDFREILEEQTALATSDHSFSDTGTNAVKRYYRWRSSADGGTTWSAWSEVNSYWVDTGLADEYVPADDSWALVNPESSADYYVFDVYPIFSITMMSLDLMKERNRLGELLSEYLTTKDKITISFDEENYILNAQVREINRFHTAIRAFLMVSRTYHGSGYTNRVWYCEFAEDPEFEMAAPGRTDLWIGNLIAEEV